MPDRPRLLIASNRLPFAVQCGADGLELTPTTGGLASALSAVHQRGDHVWVGWPGECPDADDYTRAELIGRLHARRVVPVSLSTDDVSSYYDGVCNSVLWPVLHYLLDRLPIALPDFQPYRTVNERFADLVLAQHQPGDIIWVHDYHLLLAPALIRARIPEARIGFFLHTPFPSADVFRVLPWRREILDGMLGANVVGFQTPRDVAHFSDAVRLLTEYHADGSSVIADRRSIRVGAYPIGVDPQRASDGTPGAEPAAIGLASNPACRRFLGVDRLDYTKGILARLTAFERLLSEQPALRGQVELVQVAVPSRENIPSYAGLSRDVEALVGAINARFGSADWQPVKYCREPVSPADLAPLYRSADVMLVTSLRDGMNLVAREFVLAREDDDGVLVLSELAGASEDLRAALLVNPYAVDEMATTMARALDLEPRERRRRMRTLRQRVSGRTIDDWVARFTHDVVCASGECPDAGEAAAAAIDAAGSRDRRVALVLRYEDVLAEGADSSVPSDPDPELIDLLRAACGRPGVTLHIVSAFDHQTMDRWFDLVPAVIWAEHGLWRRDREGHRWRLTQWSSGDWKDDVRELMQQFVSRTPGSFVEECGASLRWHFGRSEPLFGRSQAQTLASVLGEGAESLGYDVVVSASTPYVEIRLAGLSIARGMQKLVELDPEAQVILVDRAEHLEAAGEVLRAEDLRVACGGRALPGMLSLPDRRSLRRMLSGQQAGVVATPESFPVRAQVRARPRYAPTAGAPTIYVSPLPASPVRIGR